MLFKGGGEPRAIGSAYYMHYNFGRPHKTLRVPPAMAAGVDRLWSISDMVAVLEAWEAKQQRPPNEQKTLSRSSALAYRAEGARKLAAEILDPVSSRMMLDIAESYESLARRAAQRLQDTQN
jgi:hypothetical protein